MSTLGHFARRTAVGCLALPILLAAVGTATAGNRWTPPWRRSSSCDVCPPARIAPNWSSDIPAPASPPHDSVPPAPSTTDPSVPPDPFATPNNPPQNNPAPNDPARQLTNPDQVFNDPNGAPDAAFQAASNPVSAAPNTIGDFFGTVAVNTKFAGAAGQIGSSSGKQIIGPYGSVAGRQKFVENESLNPADRVFVNYSYFGDVPLTPPGMSVNRWTYGVEKTVFDGDGSIEIRLPTAATLNSDIHTQHDNLSGSNFELGNLNVTGKVVLARTETSILTAGLSVNLPTADDLRLFAENTGAEVLRYDNRSVHLLPFIGMLCTPTERTFTQFTVQLDIDVNGNPVLASTDDGFRKIGVANDSTYVYATWAAGWWLTQERDNGRVTGGLAPIVELHYNRTLRDADRITFTDAGTSVAIGDYDDRSFEALNLTLGLFSVLSPHTTLTAGYAVPMAGVDRDDEFNGEVRLLLNHYFGPRPALPLR